MRKVSAYQSDDGEFVGTKEDVRKYELKQAAERVVDSVGGRVYLSRGEDLIEFLSNADVRLVAKEIVDLGL